LKKKEGVIEMTTLKHQARRAASQTSGGYLFRRNGAAIIAKFGLWLILLALSGVARSDDTVMEVIPVNNRPAEELPPLLAPLLEDGDRVVSAGSSLVVKTAPERLEGIVSLIKKLDAKLSNLIVSVLQSNTKTAAELNAEAAIAVSPSSVQMRGKVGGRRKQGRHKNMQIIRTLEGQAAHIQVGNIKPVRNINVYGSGYGYPAVSSTTQMIEASTGFAVIPRLVGGQVLIDVEPWSDRFQRGGNIETQGASTSLRANLGEWVEIAGSDASERSERAGIGVYRRRSGEKHMRILIKIDKAD